MEIFKLFGTILVDSDKAQKSIHGTGKDADKMTTKLGKGIKTAAKWGAGMVTAAGAAGAALYGTAKKAADATDRIDKMSQQLGMSRKGFQEWEYILSQNGVEIDSLKGGMKTLTNSVDDLANGTGTATDAFGKLGIKYEDLEGLSREEIFEKTITALQGVGDETERAAIANDLLGRSGQELAPLLNAGAESIDRMKNEANEMGLVMSDNAIDAGVKFTDTVDKLKRSFTAAGTTIGVQVMPIVQSFLDWVIAHMPEIQAFTSKAFDAISKAVSIAYSWFMEYLYPALRSLYDWVVDNWDTISMVVGTAFDVIGIAIGVVVDIVSLFWEGLKSAYYWITGTFVKIKGTFGDIFDGVNEKIESTIGWIKDLIGWAGDAIDKVKDIGGGIKEKASNVGSSISSKLGSAKSWITGKLSGERADGGPVAAGKSYLVGERGPEIFTPGTSGNIIPNGGFANQFNISSLVVREEADIQRIARELYNLQINGRRGLGMA